MLRTLADSIDTLKACNSAHEMHEVLERHRADAVSRSSSRSITFHDSPSDVPRLVRGEKAVLMANIDAAKRKVAQASVACKANSRFVTLMSVSS
eukprot:328257-Rhodomonas_salina.1